MATITTPTPMKIDPNRPGQIPCDAGSEPIVPVRKPNPCSWKTGTASITIWVSSTNRMSIVVRAATSSEDDRARVP